MEKDKKIGLLTYHDACNFGANLQALSTIGYFRSKGISIEVINWSPNDLQDYYSRMVIPSQRKEHSEFVNAFLPISSVCGTSEDVADLIINNGYTDVIVGSDAVFSYKPILSRIHLSRRTGVAMTKVTKDILFGEILKQYVQMLNCLRCLLLLNIWILGGVCHLRRNDLREHLKGLTTFR